MSVNGFFVEQWGAPYSPEAPCMVMIHGITANSHALARLARAQDADVCVIAPDLRGRGRSAHLPGPFGIEQHADDVIAIMDELEIPSAMLVGHSMGAFVSVVAATKHPERVESVVLLDGGLPAPMPDGADAQEVLDAMLGPTIARLAKSFETFDEYVAFWKTHPAMVEIDDEYLREYSWHDVEPGVTPIRSCAVEAAVRTDGEELMVDPAVRSAAERVTQPMLVCRATRGILNQPDPRIPAVQAAALAAKNANVQVVEVPDTNHFSIVAAPHAVAEVTRHMSIERTQGG